MLLLGDKEEEAGGRQLFDLDCFLSDISDTLFTMTQVTCPAPPLPEEGMASQMLQAAHPHLRQFTLVRDQWLC